MGMYWKEFTKGGYYWYQAPIEAHALLIAVSYTHLRAHETVLDLVCRLLLEKKNKTQHNNTQHNNL